MAAAAIPLVVSPQRPTRALCQGLAIATLGRFVSGQSDTDEGLSFATSQNQIACVFPAAGANYWAYSGGLLCGKTGGSAPTVSVAVWAVSGGTPGARIGYTATFSPSNTIVDATTGQNYTGAFATALQLYSGTQYALGFDSTGAGLGYVMRAASYFDNGVGGYTQPTTYYFRDRGAQPPSDPMGFTSSSTQGVIDVFVNVQANRAPTCALVGPTGSIASATPSLQFTFTDADAAAGYGDKLNTYSIQVRRKSDSVSFLNLAGFSASSAEQAAAQTNYTYNGSTLVPGTTYQIRGQVSDQFSAASAWTGWVDFTVNAGGAVTLVSPSGKQNVNTGLTFTAQWNHASALSTNAVQVQLLQNNVVVQDSGTIAKTVVSSAAPGTTFTITWAAAGFTNMAWGTAYTYRIRGRDTAGLWSTYSSPSGAIATDYYPNVPTSLSPANSLPTTSLPILSANMTDPDDTAAGTLTCTARVKSVPALVNGGFATDILGWTASNSGDNAGATVTPAYDAIVYPSGALKLAISASTAAAGNVYHVVHTATYIPVQVGESYTIRATYQTDTAALHPRLQIRWLTSAIGFISSSTETDWSPAVNTSYPRSFTATAPATAAYCQLVIMATTTAANVTGNLYFDAVTMDQAVRTKPSMAFAASKWTYQTALGTNDVSTISVSGSPTGGSFTVNVDGGLATIPFNASAATAQTALTALTTVGAGNMTCTGGPLPATPIVCTWGGTYAGSFKNIFLLGVNSLTGGSTPTPSFPHTTPGVPGDITTYGAYDWVCAGNDGTLQGSYPTQATFVYGQGPVVVVTAPAASSTQTTATPTVTWTGTGQVKYRIQIYLHGTSTLVYDSGTITSAIQSVAVPGGYLHGSPSTDYDIVVSVTNATPLTGSNVAQLFTVNFTAPSSVTNFQATPVLAGLDAQPASVLCTWDQSVYSAGVFVDYTLDRRIAGTAAGDVSTVKLFAPTSLLSNSYTDFLPLADTSWTYSLRQHITQGTDITESGRAEAQTSVKLVGIVICAAANNQGGTYRAVLSYASARSYEHHQDTQTLMPWGSTTPTILIGTQNYQVLTGTFTLLADNAATASSYIAGLRSMYAQGLVVCVRDERDRKFFGVVMSMKEQDNRWNTYTVDITVTECSFVEGV